MEQSENGGIISVFKRYPYWGWLLLSLLLWSGTLSKFYFNYKFSQSDNLSALVNNDLHQREKSADQFLKDTVFLNALCNNTLKKDDVDRLFGLPFYVYVYANDSLVYWNNNSQQFYPNSKNLGEQTINNSHGLYLTKKLAWNKNNKTILVALPVFIQYPLENNYLRSHFVADDAIPVNTKIVENAHI
jgi:hypothetical protein